MSMGTGTGLSAADVAAVVDGRNGGYNDGLGIGGGSAWWIIILLLFGWGNRNNGCGNGAQDWLPYMMSNNTNGDVQRGFDQAAITSGLTNISTGMCNGFAGVNQNLCGGFAGVNATVNNAASSAEISNNARQMANMQQLFGLQTGISNQLNNIAMNQQNSYCENRAAIADVKYAIAAENCADRAAISDGIRDLMAQNTVNTQAIVNSTNAGFQGIMDKLCQLELDGYKRENDNLRSQLNEANRAASQAAQNTLITQGFANEVDQLYSRLNSCPIPSTPVYGRTPIFTCNNGGYAGCGCAAMA